MARQVCAGQSLCPQKLLKSCGTWEGRWKSESSSRTTPSLVHRALWTRVTAASRAPACWGCCNTAPQPGGLNGNVLLRVLEATCPRPRCLQGWFLLRARREALWPSSLAHRWLTPHVTIPLSVYVLICAQISSFLSYWIRAHPNDIIVTPFPL